MGFSAHKQDKRLGPKKDGWNVLHFWVGYGSYFPHWILGHGAIATVRAWLDSRAAEWKRLEWLRQLNLRTTEVL